MNTLQLKRKIGTQLFDISTMISQVIALKQTSQEIGSELSSLGTHNQNVIGAVGITYNVIPQMLDDINKQLALAVASLEDYRDGL